MRPCFRPGGKRSSGTDPVPDPGRFSEPCHPIPPVRTTLYLLRFAGQLGAAFFVAVIYYLVAMAPAMLDGAESFIGLPVIAVVFGIIAVPALLIVGIPLRFVAVLHTWWLRVWWLPVLLSIVAVTLSVVSWLPSFQVMMHDPERQTEVPCFNPWMGYGGWLLAIFCALHFYVPLPIDRIADFLTRLAQRLWAARPGRLATVAACPHDAPAQNTE